jgi:3',5'-cyclic AMP phosphodiesterase CpdA
MFTLAHLSDVHLGPLPPGAAYKDFALKRLVGAMSWAFIRRKLHNPLVADAIAADIMAARPDHIAFTGDAVNISTLAEFPRAATWMQRLGDGKSMTFVPGNHDAYVEVPWSYGLSHMAPWMTGEMRVAETAVNARLATPFPFVRLRKNVAVIGLSSAVPQNLRKAGGSLGAVQLRSLALLLRDLRERGFARVVMIHHPPFPGLAIPRKALTDAAALRDVIAAEGAELILHGHNHRHMVSPLATRFGTAYAVGVPSASMGVAGRHTPAAWNLYEIVRSDGRWTITLRQRSYRPETGTIAWGPDLPLST